MSEITDTIEDYEAILTEVGQMAVDGSLPSTILKYLIEDRGIDGKVQLMAVFRNGFETNLGSVTCIGGWWNDGSSELDDSQIDDLLKPVLDGFINQKKLTSHCNRKSVE